MNKGQIKEVVLKNYHKGFHCAESIANTIGELFPDNSNLDCKVSSGFCGGIGRCRLDVCGALSGGIIVLGSIYGRDKGEGDISKLVDFSARLRQLFVDEFKTTVCRDVIENLENMPEYDNCKDLTAQTAWLLYNLIKEDLKQ